MVYIITYGCKVNFYESEAVASLLRANGIDCEMVSDGAISKLNNATIFVVNSCAVTSMAEKKSRYGVSKISRYHPQAEIIEMGCAFGRRSPEDVAMLVAKRCLKPAQVLHLREKAFIKVQDGCQNFCSYCIIPYKRNVLTHRSIGEVVAEINAQGAHVTEIILCGINLCYYPDFATLCRAVDGCGRRWGISSLEPPLLNAELIATLEKCVNFVPHFHICLQSGCDEVLRAMNRHYTTNDFSQVVATLRDKFPQATFATDIIVGYPTESDAMFETTYQYLKNLRFNHLHLFPFSPRLGTPAAKLKPLPNNRVTERLRKLDSLNF